MLLISDCIDVAFCHNCSVCRQKAVKTLIVLHRKINSNSREIIPFHSVDVLLEAKTAEQTQQQCFFFFILLTIEIQSFNYNLRFAGESTFNLTWTQSSLDPQPEANASASHLVANTGKGYSCRDWAFWPWAGYFLSSLQLLGK